MIFEGGVIDVHCQHIGGFHRAALGQQQRQRQLLERRDDSGDKVEQQHWRQKRQGDQHELAKATHARQARGFVQVFRDGFEAGQKDQHRAADTPQADAHDRHRSPVRAAKPVDAGDAEQGQAIIDHAVFVAQQP